MIWSYRKAYGVTKRWEAKLGAASFRIENDPDGEGATLSVRGVANHNGDYWHKSHPCARQAAKAIGAAYIGELAAQLIEKPSLGSDGFKRTPLWKRVFGASA